MKKKAMIRTTDFQKVQNPFSSPISAEAGNSVFMADATPRLPHDKNFATWSKQTNPKFLWRS